MSAEQSYSNMEDIEQVLFSTGSLKVKLLVNLYKKTKDNIRIPCIYKSSYTTKKYKDPMEVHKLSMDIKSFLVFSFYNSEVSESVFFTLAQLRELREYLRMFEYDMIGLATNEKWKGELYLAGSNDIKVNKEFIGIVEGLNNSKLVFKPGLAVSNSTSADANTLLPVLKLYINNKQAKILLEEWAVSSLMEIFKTFNMVSSTQNLLIINKLYGEDFPVLERRNLNPPF
jgi:hypothetical protein